jgi:hypothetical protein
LEQRLSDPDTRQPRHGSCCLSLSHPIGVHCSGVAIREVYGAEFGGAINKVPRWFDRRAKGEADGSCPFAGVLLSGIE